MRLRQDIIAGALFVALRFGLTYQIFSIHDWAINFLEIVFSIWAMVYYRASFRSYLFLPRYIPGASFLSFIFGLSVAEGLVGWDIPFPFDLKNGVTLLHIIVIAPLIEEILFRFLLWQPFLNRKKAILGWVATSLLFSYGHLHAAWFSSPQLKEFFLYQATYALVLGLGSGAIMYYSQSLSGAILFHLCFNLGFLARMLLH